jgi:glucose/arabinose dehydrogenase
LQGLRLETVVEKLKVPWDFAFAPNGELFCSERVGRILRISNGVTNILTEPEAVVDASAIDPGDEGGWWSTGGEDGLLGIAVDPSYPKQPYVYAYYTYREKSAPNGQLNRVVRYDVTATNIGGTEMVVIDGIPANQFHNGGRLAFGPRGYLWITCGDGGVPEASGDPSSLAGKILRVRPNGDPAPGNPAWNGNGDPRVFTVGHRNPQAISWLPDGTPVTTEHGPNAKDEVNLLSKGDHYGWPDARTREQYVETDYHRPVVNTGKETWAPTGSVFYTGDEVPALTNRLLVGALRGQHINVVTLSPRNAALPPVEDARARRFDGWHDTRFTATSHQLFPDELGRIRCVGQSPDGDVLAITSNRDGRSLDEQFPRDDDDRLVRVVQP